MITTHHDLAAPSAGPAAASGLPPDADIERITLACGGTVQLASVARSAERAAVDNGNRYVATTGA